MFLSFFFTDTATTEIYTLSLHDALPISAKIGRTLLSKNSVSAGVSFGSAAAVAATVARRRISGVVERSEEHTSELQSLRHLVCRLLLEKKKKKKTKSKKLYHQTTEQMSN